ncbi:DUF2207 domain-containing protein [Sporosarcina sp. ITBMC105]
MKRLTCFLMILLFIVPMNVSAKSFTVDCVQIKGWVQPNGDVLVNEIFTYTLDGEYKNFTRSFPEKHLNQIIDFEAYTITRPDPIVGELNNKDLTRASSKRVNETYKITHTGGSGTVSVLYTYTMKNAVISYDTYSDMAITYFESGPNHDTDLHNVTISYVLPGDAGVNNIHGFMHDRKGQKPAVYRDGIIFTTPISSASTETSTRLLFPSTLMTEQPKIAAPLSLSEVVENETATIEKMLSKLAVIPVLPKIVDNGSIVMLVLIGLLVLYKQRIFSFFGNTHLILQTDPIYLMHVDQSGKFNRKSFLAGLFALVERGILDVEMSESASRFKDSEGAPDKTLVFRQAKNVNKKILPHEQYLLTWLFKGRAGHRKFHLHDIAGSAKKADRNNRNDVRKQIRFQENHKIWHEDTLQLMKEAGALSTNLPKALKVLIFVGLMGVTSFAYYVDLAGFWGISFPIIVAVICYMLYQSNPKKKWPSIVFFIGMFAVGAQIVNPELQLAILNMVVVSAVFFFLLPIALPSSITAIYTKMSINKFRMKKKGLISELSPDEYDSWITRTYLLNRSKKRLPKLKNDLPAAAPLAPLFTLAVDPLYYTYSTWGQLKSISSSSTTKGSSYDGGGGYSGGGDGGGGGAGAE